MGFLRQPRRVLITGASRGIGRATALRLGCEGHHVVLAARDGASLDLVRQEIGRAGGHAESLSLDVTNRDSVAAGVHRALATGPIDVLVNNAGTCIQAEFMRQSTAERHGEMELNYFGAQNMVEALLPAFIARRAGTIINVSSLLGSAAAATTANYSASKAALEAWTQGLRGEVARFGIRVGVFVAPHTQTELGERTEFRGVPSLPADYVARKLVTAIDRGGPRYAGSPVYAIFLRLAAWCPRFMESRMVESVRHLLEDASSTTRRRNPSRILDSLYRGSSSRSPGGS